MHFVRQVCFILVTCLLLKLLLPPAQAPPPQPMFLVKCTNVPSTPPQGFELWLLRCLLTVCQTCQPTVLRRQCPHPNRPRPHPCLSQPRAPSRAQTKMITLCVVAHLFQEHQQILFRVLNKLLYFDRRKKKSICA